MNILFKLKTFLWVGFCVTGCILFSCTDDSGKLGLELQNPSDAVYVFNDSSFQINSYSLQQADFIYLNPGYLLLGCNNDPKLGQFTNNFMTEVSLSAFGVDFGETPVSDSLVLFLDYAYSYGDTTQTQNITIYELNKEISLNDRDTAKSIHGKAMDESVISQYYDAAKPLTTFSFKPNPSDTLPLRIKLPDALRDRILDTTFYTSQDTFNINVFRGFYFVADKTTDGGAVSYFNVGDSTRMELYYHNEKDTTSFEYDISDFSYRCNIFQRTYHSLIEPVPLETEPDISYEQELFYVKNNNALEGRIDISGLQAWSDTLGYFTINKAILEVYAQTPETEMDSLYYPHSTLAVRGINESFERYPLEDYYDPATREYSEVKYDTLPNGYGYKLNINQSLYNTIQLGKDKLSLVMEIDIKSESQSDNQSRANRTILKGATHNEYPIKLRISYTKFNVE